MKQLRLSQLCQILVDHGFPATVEGEDRLIDAVNTLEAAKHGEISFLSNERYLSAVATTGASAVILRPGLPVPDGLAAIRCEEPYSALTVAIIAIHGYREHPQWGVSERAAIDPTASIGNRANIAAGVTIGANATVGDRCTIYPGCYIADGVRIGNDCIFYPNVVVYDHSEIGSRVTIHAGSVVGEDGLGYAPLGEKWIKIPQVGRAILHDDVEIGANCTIDRATLGTTEIGAGSKFGNVVVIGHGTKVGRDCIFVGVVGIAGSVKVGNHVTLAGHVGVAGHLTIGDNATVAAKSGVKNDVPADSVVLGYPAIPIAEFKRMVVVQKRLPELAKRVKELERELEELRGLVDTPSPQGAP